MNTERLSFGGDFKGFILRNIHIIEKLSREDSINFSLSVIEFGDEPVEDVIARFVTPQEGTKGKCVFYYYGEEFKTRRNNDEYRGWLIEAVFPRGSEMLSFIHVFVDKPENLYKLRESDFKTLTSLTFSKISLRS